MKEIRIFTPASVANVSCGFDVLGFCLAPVGDEMVIRMTDKQGVKITKIEGQDLPLDVKRNVAGVAAQAMLATHPAKCLVRKSRRGVLFVRQRHLGFHQIVRGIVKEATQHLSLIHI